MEQRKETRWRVSHPAHGTVEVRAPERLKALTRAAKHWGVPWTPIARACTIVKLEESGHERV